MMHCRQQYGWSPWSKTPHPFNLTLWPSEEQIFSSLNTELPQQTTHPSSWGELLGWGQDGDTETAGTMGVQEAPTGAGSRLIQKLDSREQLSHHSCWPLSMLQSCMGLNKTWVETASLQNHGAFSLVALWIWAALVRFPCSCSMQTHTQKSPNRPQSVFPLLLCCGASRDKQLHGNFEGDNSMHTTLNPSRHIEDALKQLVGPWWPHVCVVARVCASLCKQTAPGPRALAVRTHSVLTAVPQRTWQPGGASEDASRRIIVVPQEKAPFFNTGNTRLAPWSGMHAWFIYTLQMVGRLCVSLYIYICMCACLYSHMWHQKSHPWVLRH